MDYKRICMLKDYMESMANGIDPISNRHFSTESVFNNTHLQHCFKDISSILEEHLKGISGGECYRDRRYKPKFYISDDEKQKVILSETPIPISTLVYRINDVVDNTVYKKLRATQITSWLTQEGYLEEIRIDKVMEYKKDTDKGINIGISIENHINSYGNNYVVNNYDINAQRFIIEKLNEMV